MVFDLANENLTTYLLDRLYFEVDQNTELKSKVDLSIKKLEGLNGELELLYQIPLAGHKKVSSVLLGNLNRVKAEINSRVKRRGCHIFNVGR